MLAALEAEPMDDEDGRAAVAELGIDAKRLAARLRSLVVERDDIERRARYAAAAADRHRELADLHTIPAAPKRSRAAHIAEIRSFISKLPPEQVSMHFMKFETARDEDLARLEALARYLSERPL
ncbi:MAG: hypothetical protein SFX73_00825 [Kofleriaceae bacterium]|nr:hypothetical protein [Kofleriaceae bacterium]